MSRIAIMFPGQGSQSVGMGKDFYNRYDSAKDVFQKADDILGYSLSKIIFEGPEDELRVTKHTQPAILATSIAMWSAFLVELELTPDFMSGHSLGEYSALTASGHIRLEDSINIVRNRGVYMDEASNHCKGTMAAIIGIDRMELERICEYVTESGHIVQLANHNCPNQIVISGLVEGVEQVGQFAKEKGAKKVIPLSVSGPFHSKLMETAKEKLAILISGLEIKNSGIQVVMNVTARPESNQLQIKNNLINQVISQVLWMDSIEWMINNGVDTFIEVGPSKVLTGLVKKINDKVNLFNVYDIDSLFNIKEQIKVVK